MTKEQLKKFVQNEIANARTKQALAAIGKWANENRKQQLIKDTSLLQGKLKALNRESNLGLLPTSEVATRMANLTYAVLNLLEGEEPAVENPTAITPPPSSQFIILMLTANPSGTAKLNLDKEHSMITGKLQDDMDRLRLFVKRAVNAGEFQETTEEVKPQVLHFSGHGEGGEKGGIIVQNDDRNDEDLIPTEGLDALFEYFKDEGIGLQTVVLNACYSGEQAAVIAKYVPHVIGTTIAIGDKAAIAFSSGFYYKLAETEFDYERAFRSGRTRATMAGASKSHFVIFKNGEKIDL